VRLFLLDPSALDVLTPAMSEASTSLIEDQANSAAQVKPRPRIVGKPALRHSRSHIDWLLIILLHPPPPKAMPWSVSSW